MAKSSGLFPVVALALVACAGGDDARSRKDGGSGDTGLGGRAGGSPDVSSAGNGGSAVVADSSPGGGGAPRDASLDGNWPDSAAGSPDAVAVPNPCTGTPPTGIRLAPVVSGLTQAVFVTSEPGDATRLYSVEKRGLVKLLGAGGATVFLDLSAQVAIAGEQGLLGLAFHPRYGRGDDRFWVQYNADAPRETVIASFRRSATNPDVADPASESVLFRVPKVATNHNGGMLQFGPDGKLWAALGDGGGGASFNSQDPSTKLGKMLRIDVDTYPAAPPGGLGADGADPFIMHLGLRNPWRWSFDRLTGDLYIGDVGGTDWEEINAVPFGTGHHNFGWNVMEGAHCFGGRMCGVSPFTLPIHEYANRTDPTAVTGGFVYRGRAVPTLAGRYLFADVYGQVWTLRWSGGVVCDQFEITDQFVGPGGAAVARIPSFGEDANGELYVVTLGGAVYRIEAE